MRRSRGMAATFLITFSAVFIQTVALPAPVSACMCVAIRSIAEVVAEGQTTIVVGTVGAQLPDRTPVSVDTWLHGAAPADVVWVSGGSQMMTSCDAVMAAGERRLFVLHGPERGLYTADPCSVGGEIGTESGDAALAEAVALLGSGVPPPTPEPTQPPSAPTTEAPAADGVLWVVGAVGAAALLFGLLAVVALRRQPR